MKKNLILEELWQTKNTLARKAGDDVARICENTRRWAESHPHSGATIDNATELRAWLARNEDTELSVVCEDTPPYGTKGGSHPEKAKGPDDTHRGHDADQVLGLRDDDSWGRNETRL